MRHPKGLQNTTRDIDREVPGRVQGSLVLSRRGRQRATHSPIPCRKEVGCKRKALFTKKEEGRTRSSPYLEEEGRVQSLLLPSLEDECRGQSSLSERGREGARLSCHTLDAAGRVHGSLVLSRRGRQRAAHSPIPFRKEVGYKRKALYKKKGEGRTRPCSSSRGGGQSAKLAPPISGRRVQGAMLFPLFERSRM